MLIFAYKINYSTLTNIKYHIYSLERLGLNEHYNDNIRQYEERIFINHIFLYKGNIRYDI